jgi:threonine/homoserine/homoserine lactone efflux protein
LADGPVIAVAVGVLTQVPVEFVPAISLIGGVFLLYVACTAAINAQRAVMPREQRLSARGGLVSGLLARVLSPNPYLFWFLVGAPTLVQAAQGGWLWAAAFVCGYYLAIVGSNVGLALALHRWMGLLSDRAYRGLVLFSTLILAVYGLVLVGRGVEAAQRRS